MINYDDFAKIELKIARVMEAEAVPDSDKLIRLQLSLGEESRQIVAGIGKAYAPEDLIGKEIVIVANLEPRKLMGVESNGMLLAASDEDGPVLLVPELDVPPGTGVK
jgi:methionyl-tRNA synthetase